MYIKIAYLYYDLMNLYGERGNINVLVETFKQQDINVSVTELSLNDKIDFNYYDLYVIGSGTESNQKRVLEDLKKYKDKIKDSIENGKFFLCTGNSIELFGKTIKDDDNIYEGLDIFDYDTIYKDRIVCEVLFRCELIEDYILGFQNQGGSIDNYEFNLFDVLSGIGSHIGSKKEGIHYKNFYATYVIGPILARNPKFLEKFVIDIILDKNSNYRYKTFDLKLDKDAQDNFIKLYHPDYYE